MLAKMNMLATMKMLAKKYGSLIGIVMEREKILAIAKPRKIITSKLRNTSYNNSYQKRFN